MLAIGVVGGGLAVVTLRNIIHSAVAMMICFGSLAGMYALLGAPIVAAAQVLIYLGAISVLILFAIMLTQSKSGPAQLVFHRQAWAGALAAFGFAFLLIAAVINTQWPLRVSERLHTSTREVAMLLFQDAVYVLSLQVIAVLLTAAVIGAVFLAKREDVPDPGDSQAPVPLRVRPPLSASPVDEP